VGRKRKVVGQEAAAAADRGMGLEVVRKLVEDTAAVAADIVAVDIAAARIVAADIAVEGAAAADIVKAAAAVV